MREGFSTRIILGGPPRSGTSLLRVLMDASDGLVGLAETGFFLRSLPYLQSHVGLVAKRIDRVFQLGEETVSRVLLSHQNQVACFDALMALFLKGAGLTKRGWLEKTPRNCEHYRELEAQWPEFYFVSTVRDGRDIVTSHIDGREGYHCPVERYCRSMECVFSFVSPRHMIVRYEDLVSAPERELRRVFAFVGLDFDPLILERYSQPSVTRDPGLMQQPLVFSPIRQYHEQRWQKPEHAERLAEFEASPAAIHYNRLAGYQ